ncbi:hypothetical protein SLS62_001586 [Diatrype stigma]|uniref:1,3-beta-glucanosyltransferase n=1 Tax=Diatrype stigma TaxID=117547 RepID=A0AAN9UVQ9_9PEZI
MCIAYCLSTPHKTILRSAPFESYTADLLQSAFRVVDCMSAYNNTLGVLVANAVINSYPTTVAAPVVRAITRDVKRYMVLAAEADNQRILPVGVSSPHRPSLIRCQFEYFSAGDEKEAIDFFSVRKFEDTPIPIFFSEYGAKLHASGRLFAETRAILSSYMTDTFSGGIVYGFFEAIQGYGLVKRHEDGSIEKLPDFNNLRESVQACAELKHNTSLEAPAGCETEVADFNQWWKAKPEIPESPLDWDEVREQVEDRQWVDVGDEMLDLQVEDLAASVWQRFRIDGTGPRLD